MANTLSKIVAQGNITYLLLLICFSTGDGIFEEVVLVGSEKGNGGKIEAPYGIAIDEQTNSCIVSEFFNPQFRKVLFSV